jgi:hypothetical protein
VLARVVRIVSGDYVRQHPRNAARYLREKQEIVAKQGDASSAVELGQIAEEAELLLSQIARA